MLKAIDDGTSFRHAELIDALAIWGTADCVLTLIDIMDEGGWDAENALRALGKIKDPRGARAVAKKLQSRDARKAVTALREMGPVAEDAVLALLNHADPSMRGEMCLLLEKIGTTKCIPELRKRVGDKSKAVSDAAKSAIGVVQARGATPYVTPAEGEADPFRVGSGPPQRPPTPATKNATPEENPFQERSDPPQPKGAPSDASETKGSVPKALQPVPR